MNIHPDANDTWESTDLYTKIPFFQPFNKDQLSFMEKN